MLYFNISLNVFAPTETAYYRRENPPWRRHKSRPTLKRIINWTHICLVSNSIRMYFGEGITFTLEKRRAFLINTSIQIPLLILS